MKKLSEYNMHIMKWKESLPEDLAWDKNFLQETADNPTLLCIRYYYYILILCLNRPFVGISKSAVEEHHLSPATICTNAIEDLYVAIRRFKETHGLRRASIFMVYCSILSISVILLTNTSKHLRGQRRFETRLADPPRTVRIEPIQRVLDAVDELRENAGSTSMSASKSLYCIVCPPRTWKESAVSLPRQHDVKNHPSQRRSPTTSGSPPGIPISWSLAPIAAVAVPATNTHRHHWHNVPATHTTVGCPGIGNAIGVPSNT